MTSHLNTVQNFNNLHLSEEAVIIAAHAQAAASALISPPD